MPKCFPLKGISLTNKRTFLNESGCFETLDKDLLKNMYAGEERSDDTTQILYDTFNDDEEYKKDMCK